MTQAVTHHEASAVPVDSFEARLMLARLHAGRLSIRQAAERCGYKHESWSGWERGRQPYDKLEVARAVADNLGVDYDWLLHGGPLAQEVRRRRDRHGRLGRNIPPSSHVTHRAARITQTDRTPVAVTVSDDAATATTGRPYGPRTARPMWRHA